MTEDPSIPATTNLTKLVAVVIVALSVLTVTGVVLLAVLVPQNTSAVSVIIGLMTPILTALLAFAIHSMSASIDGRMTQLLAAKAKQEHAAGFVQGLVVNPNAALQRTDVPEDVLKP